MQDAIDCVQAASTEAPCAAGWHAELRLAYARRGERTALVERAHRGPLVMQKPLYPEGPRVCQTIVVHPPAGIVGGDRLLLEVDVGRDAHAQLTTPGAAKWYRSPVAHASQRLAFDASPGAVIEWLPQETIVFDGARADLATTVTLADDATFIGWEIVCLGRRMAGERFTHGTIAQHTEVRRRGRRVWVERGRVDGGGARIASPVALGEHSVHGTLLAISERVTPSLMRACREIRCDEGDGAVTRVPGALVARYRGDSSEAARHYFGALWRCARPALAGREACFPRIWNT